MGFSNKNVGYLIKRCLSSLKFFIGLKDLLMPLRMEYNIVHMLTAAF